MMKKIMAEKLPSGNVGLVDENVHYTAGKLYGNDRFFSPNPRTGFRKDELLAITKTMKKFKPVKYKRKSDD